MKNVKELTEKIEKMEKELEEESKRAFKEVSADLFKNNPLLKSFSWRQYTPYFNDGDPCIFGASVDGDAIVINDIEGYDVYDYKNGKRVPVKEHEDIFPLYEEISEFLSEFKQEVLQRIFGDHISVTVTKDGVEIEEYEHD